METLSHEDALKTCFAFDLSLAKIRSRWNSLSFIRCLSSLPFFGRKNFYTKSITFFICLCTPLSVKLQNDCRRFAR